ncbi:MAG: DNA gyrase subunit A, partial [Clostridia bacterium]
MAKKVVNNDVKDTIIKVPISKFIDTQFRNYALYVLESRGIPSFYDALTNVQRYILKNCPANFVKSLTVVGKCIEDHYHHGNSSLDSAIARMTRPFGNSAQLLDGYGFFGTEVCPFPSAARYTSVRLSPMTRELMSKYSYLTTRISEGPYNHFWLECPIGLTLPVIGIAVGYKTMILPRKIEEIQKYIKGEKADLKPYLQGYKGTIKQFQTHKNWLFQGTVTTDNKKINVTNMPPMLKYTSVLKKIDTMFSKYEGKLGMENNSDTIVNITFNYRGNSQQEFDDIVKYITKTFSIIVSENIVFIKDSKVLEYDTIEEYLEDWK